MTVGEVLVLVFLVVEDVEEVELATSELLVLEIFTRVRLVLDDEDEPATGVMLVLEP